MGLAPGTINNTVHPKLQCLWSVTRCRSSSNCSRLHRSTLAVQGCKTETKLPTAWKAWSPFQPMAIQANLGGSHPQMWQNTMAMFKYPAGPGFYQPRNWFKNMFSFLHFWLLKMNHKTCCVRRIFFGFWASKCFKSEPLLIVRFLGFKSICFNNLCLFKSHASLSAPFFFAHFTALRRIFPSSPAGWSPSFPLWLQFTNACH